MLSWDMHKWINYSEFLCFHSLWVKQGVQYFPFCIMAGLNGFWGKTREAILGFLNGTSQPSAKSFTFIKDQMKIVIPASSDVHILGGSWGFLSSNTENSL